jgi:hypothetical protein
VRAPGPSAIRDLVLRKRSVNGADTVRCVRPPLIAILAARGKAPSHVAHVAAGLHVVRRSRRTKLVHVAESLLLCQPPDIPAAVLEDSGFYAAVDVAPVTCGQHSDPGDQVRSWPA